MILPSAEYLCAAHATFARQQPFPENGAGRSARNPVLPSKPGVVAVPVPPLGTVPAYLLAPIRRCRRIIRERVARDHPMQTARPTHTQSYPLKVVLFLLLLVSLLSGREASAQIDGFTEPYRTIHVAAPESGIVTNLAVREGDRVKRGQVLAELDLSVWLAALEIAKKRMELQGRLQSAKAELRIRKVRLSKLEALRTKGYARQEEVDRAKADMEIASAGLLAAQEEQLIRKLEYAKIKAQVERRTIRSPIAGVVTKLHKEEAEFVAPNDPQILTIVQLDPLRATFSVSPIQAVRLSKLQKVRVSFTDLPQSAEAAVEFISPVTDAESGTVRIKVIIDNPKSLYRSGERCALLLPDGNAQRRPIAD